MMSVYASVLTRLWTSYPYLMLDFCRSTSGETFSVALASGQKLLIVSAPDHVEQLFKSTAASGNEELRPYLGDGSLFLRKGPEHAQARRWMRSSVAEAVSPSVFARCVAMAAAEASAETCDPYPLFRTAALRSILEACFGPQLSTVRLERLIERLFREMTAYRLFSYEGVVADEGPATALRDVRAELARLLDGPATEPYSPVFATSAKENADSGKQAVDDVLTFIAAGAEPLAATLCWVLYFLSRDVALGDRVDAELTGAKQGDEPPLTAAVIKETLRLTPVVPVVDRVITAPTRIAGRQFEEGDRVAACAYLTHRRPDAFAEPKAFRPDRFLSRSWSPFEYYPFGGGTRRCVGATSAARVLPAGLKAFRSAYRFHSVGLPSPTMYNVIVAPRARARIAPLAGVTF